MRIFLAGGCGVISRRLLPALAASGATAVQLVWSPRGGVRQIEHLGSVHDEAEPAALRTVATERIAGSRSNRREING